MLKNRSSAIAMMIVAGGLATAIPATAAPVATPAVSDAKAKEIVPCVKTKVGGLAPCVKTRDGQIAPCVKTKTGDIAPCVKTKGARADSVAR